MTHLVASSDTPTLDPNKDFNSQQILNNHIFSDQFVNSVNVLSFERGAGLFAFLVSRVSETQTGCKLMRNLALQLLLWRTLNHGGGGYKHSQVLELARFIHKLILFASLCYLN